jgi:glycerol kinase
MGACLLAIDQGTTGTTCLVLRMQADGGTQVLGQGYCELPQHFAQPGWVEHDLNAIWQGVCTALGQALAAAKCRGEDIAAIGIANQRETVGLWARDGRPLARAIVWQDRRTADACQALEQAGHGAQVQARTGLRLDPYFSASKLNWMLQRDPALRGALARGEALCGTIDTWLIYKLTGHRVYATDVTNASRTLLYNIHTGLWDAQLAALFDDFPLSALAEVRACDAGFGVTRGVPHLPDGIALCGVAGDQQAALFGQACFTEGMAKCTFGTGAFALVNTGSTPAHSHSGLLTTPAWRLGSHTTYALEGSIFVAGAVVQWLRDGLGLFASSHEVEALAAQVQDAGGVTVVPALTGLGAPHWRPEARGLISGITRGTTRAHIARAALEGIAWQAVDLMDAMRRDSGAALRLMRVDGGASANNLLMQFLADIMAVPIHRPPLVASTALGAACLAALGVGHLATLDDVTRALGPAHVFVPQMPPEEVARRAALWQAALAKA